MSSPQRADSAGMSPWDPRVALRQVDPQLARYSSGFLKARPERWFPGFAALWLPLAHSFGAELRVSEVRPQLSWPTESAYTFVASVDDEPLLMRIERDSARVLLEALLPGAGFKAAEVFLEYLARRLVSTVGVSWTGPQTSTIRFEPEMNPTSVRSMAAVKLQLQVNGQSCILWLILGKFLVDKLDTLWKRQQQSVQRGATSDGGNVFVELGQLAVPPNMLVDYTRSGALIDLEVPVSDLVSIRLPDNSRQSCRLVAVGNSFGLEALSGQVNSAPLPTGTTRLVVELPAISLDSAQISDLATTGALIESELPLSAAVRLTVNGQMVKEASLCTYEGRFAVSVG